MLSCGSVFSGIGLLDYGLHLAGIEHRWLCEWDPWRRDILRKRWPGVRVLDDVRDAGHGCEPVDLIAGGFPCKGASSAGKQNGFDHPETVLWREMRRAVRELRPRYVLVENVANILSLHRGEVWGEVLGDLAALGYDVVWDCIPAAAVGAPHLRDRVFAVATYTDGAYGQRLAGLGGGPHGRADARGGGDGSVADLAWDGEGRSGAPARSDGQRARAGDNAPTPDADGERRREGRGIVRQGRSEVGRGLEAASDTGGGRQHEQPELYRAAERTGFQVPAGDDAQRRGVRVEWGPYGPAIRRWERVRGAAPEPLVRRVDDRSAARVERSRLSALGDGVCVQVGRLAGAYIVELERRRLADAA